MKKIGLITFHASHNNGSMLQALALQTILEKKYNCKVEIINFSNESQRNMYAVLPAFATAPASPDRLMPMPMPP